MTYFGREYFNAFEFIEKKLTLHKIHRIECSMWSYLGSVHTPLRVGCVVILERHGHS